jgi:endonuclease G
MGTPKTAFLIKLLERRGFTIGYDEEKHNPAWVFYYVPRGDAEHSPKRPEKFSPDPEINAHTLSKDYDHSGFDRGHMAPNFAIGTRYGVAAQNQTFLMSNIVPQKPGLNRGIWKDVEALIAGKTGYANRFNGVWVVVGPIYSNSLSRNKLKGGEWVPDAFYQIIVKEENSQPNALAFIIPQEVGSHSKPEDYLTSISEIERVTGIHFFYQLPKQVESNLESSKPKVVW